MYTYVPHTHIPIHVCVYVQKFSRRCIYNANKAYEKYRYIDVGAIMEMDLPSNKARESGRKGRQG